MRLKFTFQKYESKLATLCSIMKHNFIAAFALLFFIFNIPTIVCGICGVSNVTNILLIVSIPLTLVTSILFCIFINPDKIDNHMTARKHKKHNDEVVYHIPEHYRNIEDIKRREVVGSEVAEELKEIREKQSKQ